MDVNWSKLKHHSSLFVDILLMFLHLLYFVLQGLLHVQTVQWLSTCCSEARYTIVPLLLPLWQNAHILSVTYHRSCVEGHVLTQEIRYHIYLYLAALSLGNTVGVAVRERSVRLSPMRPWFDPRTHFRMCFEAPVKINSSQIQIE